MSAAQTHVLHSDVSSKGEPVPLPPALHQIAERIEASRAFVRTDTNHDAEGGGYDEETWQRAVRFVSDATNSYWRKRRSVPPAPVISDGPDGVVDVLWKYDDRQLLLTVHPDLDDVATFYGRNLESGGDIVRGELALDQNNEWLLVWLTK
jgi:hypothetical protein